MKILIIGVAIIAASLSACNGGANKSIENNNTKDTVQGKSQTDSSGATASITSEEKSNVSIKEIISAYLQLKNAFTKDNTTEAATAGAQLEIIFKNFDKVALNVQQKKTFEDVEDDAREHAEHIGKNGGNIAHQREHFEMLSKDMYDLVKVFGGGQVLYKDFCPMYNNNKGAFWISETKEIKNPYLGKAMPTCGSVKEEIK